MCKLMGDMLQDIMVINFDGKTLACRMVNLLEKSDYIGMLISALTMLAEEIKEGGLSCFEFNSLRFNLLKRNRIIFMGTSDKRIKQGKVLRKLNGIANQFFSKYSPKTLKNLNADLQRFSSFEQELSKPTKKEQLLDFISNHWPSTEYDLIKK